MLEFARSGSVRPLFSTSVTVLSVISRGRPVLLRAGDVAYLVLIYLRIVEEALLLFELQLRWTDSSIRSSVISTLSRASTRTPGVPSARDGGLAAYPEAVHLIVSLAAPELEARCYHIEEPFSTSE